MEWVVQDMHPDGSTRMIEFENDFLHVWIDKEIHFMQSEWKRNVSSNEYRKGHRMHTNMLKKHGIKYLIIDSTKLGEISIRDEKWFLKVLIPSLLQTDLKKVARVSGEINPGYTRLDTFFEQVKEAFDDQVEVRNCITFKEAADWMGNIRV